MPKVRATSHGPGALKVRRRRCQAPCPAAAVWATGSAGTLRHNHAAMASDTAANSHHQAPQPHTGMNSGPASKASAVPVGMYAPHTPSMPGSCAGSTRRRIKAGAGKATSKKPRPSMARSTSNAAVEVANAPKPLASASRHRPRTMLRLRPMPSAHKPMNTARLKPASCTMDKRKPDCSSVRPSSACSAGKAGGSLPTCKAATPPAKTTSQAVRCWGGVVMLQSLRSPVREQGLAPTKTAQLAHSSLRPVRRSCSRKAKRSVMPAM